MAYDIRATDTFDTWFGELDASERVAIARMIEVLAEGGPTLGRPRVDTVKGSQFPNMKELRIQHGGKPYRVLFAFDPTRAGILLVGGKKGAKHWYENAIALADKLYGAHLANLRKRGIVW